ncbi:MAG: Gfo/Idh/MocA family oxidoreductase [Victivallales bacterium]|nr:Gfo/Idh/MocA family oxidoreductase [Victivallales bacterium]
MNTIELENLRKPDGTPFFFEYDRKKVVEPDEFQFAAVQFEHGHIYGQISHFKSTGAKLKWIFDKRPDVLKTLAEKYPDAKVARSIEEILDDPQVKLVTAADVPCDRAALGIACMKAGKDYYTDKTPFTTLEQLAEVKRVVAETGRKYGVNYSERLGSEVAFVAGDMIEQGAIGKVVSIIGVGPHRMGAPSTRPAWFFKKAKCGGILIDIGSHQCEQFLHYAGAKDATVNYARVDNFHYPQFPEFEDFGEASLTSDNGVSFYYRVDWFTPDGLSNWGDGRTLIVGTDGYIELRKFVDVATGLGGNQMYYVNKVGEYHVNAQHTVGTPFFSKFVLDCINRTECAMTQERAFKAAELCMKCQQAADARR